MGTGTAWSLPFGIQPGGKFALQGGEMVEPGKARNGALELISQRRLLGGLLVIVIATVSFGSGSRLLLRRILWLFLDTGMRSRSTSQD